MQDFHCNCFKNIYADKAEMWLTDIDSHIYKLKLEMSMKTSKKIELFDVSDYSKVTQYYNN